MLLAGAWRDERQPPERAGAEPGWHQPPHVRHPAEARRRLVEQIAAGADAIVAPAYRTSRAALALFGEARRAREWTEFAARIAREAVEEAAKERAAPTAGVARGEVLVCGAVTPLAADNFAAHAEILAEAGADVLLIEQMGSVAASRAAAHAAGSTGLPVWSGVSLSADGTRLESGESLEAWVEALEPTDPALLLAWSQEPAAALGAAVELVRLSGRPLGACLERPITAEQAGELLDSGFTLVGLSSGATAETLPPLRAALDERLGERAEAEAAARRALQERLEQAAAWATGGPALWLGDPPQVDLPAGFDWTVLPSGEVGHLPRERYRLAVVAPARDDQQDGVRLLSVVEAGGIVLVPAYLADTLDRDSARTIDRWPEPAMAVLRRE